MLNLNSSDKLVPLPQLEITFFTFFFFTKSIIDLLFFCFLVLITFGEYLSSLFTKDLEVIKLSKDYLFIFAFSTFFFVIIHMSGSIFQGIKRPLYTTLYAFVRLGILPIIVLYSINKYLDFGISGIWIGMLLINVIAAIIIFYHLRKVLFSIESKLEA